LDPQPGEIEDFPPCLKDLSMLPIILVGSAVTLFLVVLLVFLFVASRKRRRVLDLLAQKVGAVGSGRKFTAVHEGVPYRYEYFPGSGNSPSRFQVATDSPLEGSFKIGREKAFDRFSKNLGIAREIQTGDPDFDREFYISSSDEEFARGFFSDAQRRQAVRDVFRLGFTEIKLDKKGMEAVLTPFPLREDIDPSFLPAAAQLLIRLAQDPSVSYVPPAYIEDPSWKTRRIAAFAIPSLLLVAGTASWIWGGAEFTPLDPEDVFLDSLKYSLPGLGIFLWWAVRALVGRSTSHKELLVVLVLSLAGFLVAGGGAETLANGILDTSPHSGHEARVLQKYVTRSKNSTTYHVQVESWRSPTQPETISIRSSDYGRIQPGRTTVLAVTKPGRLGFEWLVAYEIRNPLIRK